MGLKRKVVKASSVELSIEDAFEEYTEEKKSMNLSPKTINNFCYSIVTLRRLSFEIIDHQN